MAMEEHEGWLFVDVAILEIEIWRDFVRLEPSPFVTCSCPPKISEWDPVESSAWEQDDTALEYSKYTDKSQGHADLAKEKPEIEIFCAENNKKDSCNDVSDLTTKSVKQSKPRIAWSSDFLPSSRNGRLSSHLDMINEDDEMSDEDADLGLPLLFACDQKVEKVRIEIDRISLPSRSNSEEKITLHSSLSFDSVKDTELLSVVDWHVEVKTSSVSAEDRKQTEEEVNVPTHFDDEHKEIYVQPVDDNDEKIETVADTDVECEKKSGTDTEKEMLTEDKKQGSYHDDCKIEEEKEERFDEEVKESSIIKEEEAACLATFKSEKDYDIDNKICPPCGVCEETNESKADRKTVADEINNFYTDVQETKLEGIVEATGTNDTSSDGKAVDTVSEAEQRFMEDSENQADNMDEEWGKLAHDEYPEQDLSNIKNTLGNTVDIDQKDEKENKEKNIEKETVDIEGWEKQDTFEEKNTPGIDERNVEHTADFGEGTLEDTVEASERTVKDTRIVEKAIEDTVKIDDKIEVHTVEVEERTEEDTVDIERRVEDTVYADDITVKDIVDPDEQNVEDTVDIDEKSVEGTVDIKERTAEVTVPVDQMTVEDIIDNDERKVENASDVEERTVEDTVVIVEPQTADIDDIVAPETTDIENNIEPETAGIEDSIVQERSDIDDSVVPETTDIDNSVAPEITDIDDTIVPETADIDDSVVQETTDIDDSVVPETTDIDDTIVLETADTDYSVVPQTTDIDNSVVPETTDIDDSVVEETTDIGDIVVEETTDIDDSIAPETTDIDDNVVPETTDIDDTIIPEKADIDYSVVPETADIDGSVAPETTYIDDSVVSETTDIDDSVVPETTDIDDTIVLETADTDYSVVPQTTDIGNSVVEETTDIDDSIAPKTTDIDDSVVPETTDIDDSVEPETTDIDDSVVPGTTDIDDTIVLETADTDYSVVPQTTDIDDIVSPETTDIDDSVEPQTADIDDSVAPETTDIDDVVVEETTDNGDIVVEETTDIDNSVVPQTTDIDDSVVPETTDIADSVVEETTDIDDSVVPETADIDGIVLPETADIDGIVLPETADIDGIVLPETTDIDDSVVPETADIDGIVLPETADIDGIVLPETTDIDGIVLPETADIDGIVLPETADIDGIVLPETTDIDDSVVPETADIDGIVLPEIADIDGIVLPETTDIDDSVVPETTVIDDSVVPETTDTDDSVAPETTDIADSVVEETTDIDDSIAPETTDIDDIVVEETTDIDDSLAPETTDIDDRVVPETTDIDDTIVPEKADIDYSVVPETADIDGSVAPETTYIDDSVVSETTDIDDSVVPEPTDIDDTIVPETADTDYSVVQETTDIDDSVVEETTDIDGIVLPETADTDYSVVPETADIDGLVLPETTDIDGIVVPETTDIDDSVVPETTDIADSVVEETTDIDDSVVPETADIDGIVLPETADIDGIVLPETADIDGIVLPETTDIDDSVVPETADIDGIVLPETADIDGIVLPETADIDGIVLPETADIDGIVLPETTDIDDSVVPETADIDGIVLPETADIDGIVLPETTDIDDSVVPETTVIDDSVVPETTDTDDSVAPETTDIADGVVEETTDIDDSIAPETTDIDDRVVPETADIDGIVLPETADIDGIVLPETTDIDDSVVPETADIDDNVVPETADIVDSVVPETADIDGIVLPETIESFDCVIPEARDIDVLGTSDIHDIVIPETTNTEACLITESADTDESVIPKTREIEVLETTDMHDNVIPETTEIDDSVVEETTDIADSVVEETTDIADSVVEETTDIADSVVEETTEIDDSVVPETTEIDDRVIRERTDTDANVLSEMAENGSFIQQADKTEPDDSVVTATTVTGVNMIVDRTGIAESVVPDINIIIIPETAYIDEVRVLDTSDEDSELVILPASWKKLSCASTEESILPSTESADIIFDNYNEDRDGLDDVFLPGTSDIRSVQEVIWTEDSDSIDLNEKDSIESETSGVNETGVSGIETEGLPEAQKISPCDLSVWNLEQKTGLFSSSHGREDLTLFADGGESDIKSKHKNDSVSESGLVSQDGYASNLNTIVTDAPEISDLYQKKTTLLPLKSDIDAGIAEVEILAQETANVNTNIDQTLDDGSDLDANSATAGQSITDYVDRSECSGYEHGLFPRHALLHTNLKAEIDHRLAEDENDREISAIPGHEIQALDLTQGSEIEELSSEQTERETQQKLSSAVDVCVGYGFVRQNTVIENPEYRHRVEAGRAEREQSDVELGDKFDQEFEKDTDADKDEKDNIRVVLHDIEEGYKIEQEFDIFEKVKSGDSFLGTENGVETQNSIDQLERKIAKDSNTLEKDEIGGSFESENTEDKLESTDDGDHDDSGVTVEQQKFGDVVLESILEEEDEDSNIWTYNRHAAIPADEENPIEIEEVTEQSSIFLERRKAIAPFLEKKLAERLLETDLDKQASLHGLDVTDKYRESKTEYDTGQGCRSDLENSGIVLSERSSTNEVENKHISEPVRNTDSFENKKQTVDEFNITFLTKSFENKEYFDDNDNDCEGRVLDQGKSRSQILAEDNFEIDSVETDIIMPKQRLGGQGEQLRSKSGRSSATEAKEQSPLPGKRIFPDHLATQDTETNIIEPPVVPVMPDDSFENEELTDVFVFPDQLSVELCAHVQASRPATAPKDTLTKLEGFQDNMLEQNQKHVGEIDSHESRKLQCDEMLRHSNKNKGNVKAAYKKKQNSNLDLNTVIAIEALDSAIQAGEATPAAVEFTSIDVSHEQVKGKEMRQPFDRVVEREEILVPEMVTSKGKERKLRQESFEEEIKSRLMDVIFDYTSRQFDGTNDQSDDSDISLPESEVSASTVQSVGYRDDGKFDSNDLEEVSLQTKQESKVFASLENVSDGRQGNDAYSKTTGNCVVNLETLISNPSNALGMHKAAPRGAEAVKFEREFTNTDSPMGLSMRYASDTQVSSSNIAPTISSNNKQREKGDWKLSHSDSKRSNIGSTSSALQHSAKVIILPNLEQHSEDTELPHSPRKKQKQSGTDVFSSTCTQNGSESPSTQQLDQNLSSNLDRKSDEFRGIAGEQNFVRVEGNFSRHKHFEVESSYAVEKHDQNRSLQRCAGETESPNTKQEPAEVKPRSVNEKGIGHFEVSNQQAFTDSGIYVEPSERQEERIYDYAVEALDSQGSSRNLRALNNRGVRSSGSERYVSHDFSPYPRPVKDPDYDTYGLLYSTGLGKRVQPDNRRGSRDIVVQDLSQLRLRGAEEQNSHRRDSLLRGSYSQEGDYRLEDYTSKRTERYTRQDSDSKSVSDVEDTGGLSRWYNSPSRSSREEKQKKDIAKYRELESYESRESPLSHSRRHYENVRNDSEDYESYGNRPRNTSVLRNKYEQCDADSRHSHRDSGGVQYAVYSNTGDTHTFYRSIESPPLLSRSSQPSVSRQSSIASEIPKHPRLQKGQSEISSRSYFGEHDRNQEIPEFQAAHLEIGAERSYVTDKYQDRDPREARSSRGDTESSNNITDTNRTRRKLSYSNSNYQSTETMDAKERRRRLKTMDRQSIMKSFEQSLNEGNFDAIYNTGSHTQRLKNRLGKLNDGPLSLHDSYGAGMEQVDTQNQPGSRGLSASSNHLSESTASLANNRHPHPVASPGTKQHGSIQKQQSIQSEINGRAPTDEAPEPGIKFERLKNLSEEELIPKIKEIQGYLDQIIDYHRGDGMRVQKMLGDMYWDYPPLRETVGDTMADCGYGATSMKMLKSLNSMGIFKNDDVWFPTYYTYNTMWNFTDASNKLARSLAENDAVRLLTLNCGHKPYINAIHSKNVYYVLKASLSILHNIARNPGMKHLFDENKTSEIVMPFTQSEDEMLKILATLTIANIVDEEENKTLITETGTIQCIVSWIDKALNLPRRRYKGFTPQELTEGLNKLAVNDSNKMKIVEEGALPLMLKMLQHEDVREQSCAARIIWTLAFDKDVRVKINEFPELVPVLEKLSDSTNKSLQTNTHGALWILKGDNDVTKEAKDAMKDSKEAIDTEPRKGKSHVFLSYCWSDKDTVLQIRDRLRAEGYAIWIDIEKMGGSTLSAMAQAVENAAVVLICMSEKYKQSPNCRTEAEYTFQLRKEYIPIMMQKKYRPDGWLGIILGAKLYFDFSGKYPFAKSFQGLVKELRGRGQVTPGTTPAEDQTDSTPMAHSSSHVSLATPSHSHQLPNITNSPAYHMGQEELIKWLRNIKLTECIPAFLEFDGKLLLQLKVMRVEAPEFFYQCLEKRLNMSLIEILKFTRALEELQ